MTVTPQTLVRRRLAVALVAVTLASLAWRPLPVASSTAFHLKLLKSSPAKDSSLAASPNEIKLWFSMAPEVKLTTIHLTTKAGADVALAPLARGPAAEMSIAAPIKSPLAAGSYHVAWRTMSADGHVVKGDYGFGVGTTTPARAQR